jgi:hypothetical protein
MAKNLLFYETAVPVSAAGHRDLAVEPAKYGFATGVNAVPLTCIEFPRAAREYTIVFAGDKEVVPVALLGTSNAENLYVNSDQEWSADYVPAFVRRYPFVFSTSDDKTKLTLCIDETWVGCNREGRGQRLFDDQGERTPYLSKMLTFLEEFQAHFTRTQAYCRKLVDLGLLEPMKADMTLPGGQNRSLTGFRAVSRVKLKALPPEKLAELAQTDELELIYDHLLSMNNFSLIVDRMARQGASSAAAPAAEGNA